jgi:hypothetical protein
VSAVDRRSSLVDRRPPTDRSDRRAVGRPPTAEGRTPPGGGRGPSPRRLGDPEERVHGTRRRTGRGGARSPRLEARGDGTASPETRSGETRRRLRRAGSACRSRDAPVGRSETDGVCRPGREERLASGGAGVRTGSPDGAGLEDRNHERRSKVRRQCSDRPPRGAERERTPTASVGRGRRVVPVAVAIRHVSTTHTVLVPFEPPDSDPVRR